jgi:hypothetical protein
MSDQVETRTCEGCWRYQINFTIVSFLTGERELTNLSIGLVIVRWSNALSIAIVRLVPCLSQTLAAMHLCVYFCVAGLVLLRHI